MMETQQSVATLSSTLEREKAKSSIAIIDPIQGTILQRERLVVANPKNTLTCEAARDLQRLKAAWRRFSKYRGSLHREELPCFRQSATCFGKI
jgi:hypothetical protein